MIRNTQYKLLFIVLILVIFSGTLFTGKASKKEVNDNLRKILSDPKYRYATAGQEEKKEGPIESFLMKVYEAIAAFFSKLQAEPVLLTLFIIAGILLIALIIFIIYVLRTSFLSKNKKDGRRTKFHVEKDHFNYQKELERAYTLMMEGRLKPAVSVVLNALWLFFHHQKTIIYNKSRTNREYIGLLRRAGDDDSMNDMIKDTIKNTVYKAEKAVYLKSNIEKSECEDIYETVNDIIKKQTER